VLGQKETDEHADIIRGLPFYPQEDYQCGPASLASVLNYWGGAVTPGDVAEDIYSRSARGTLNIDMALYAEARGLDASFYSGGLPDVKSKIEAGYPLIVLVDLGFSFYQVNHFMVVVGFRNDGVIVNSGKEERKFIPTGEFLKSWEKTKFWTLFIKRK
jgi:ABC-type bacteriocin/lantibiotic exporter with double-glycine peptidase domain